MQFQQLVVVNFNNFIINSRGNLLLEFINFMDLFRGISFLEKKITVYVPGAYSFIKFDSNSYIEFVGIVYELQRKRYHFFLTKLNYQHQIYMNKRPNLFFNSMILLFLNNNSLWLKNKGKCLLLQAKTFFKSKFNNFRGTMSWWLVFCWRQMLSGDRWISFSIGE